MTCNGNSECGMFYDVAGEGTSFYYCPPNSNEYSLKKSEMGSIIYFKNPCLAKQCHNMRETCEMVPPQPGVLIAPTAVCKCGNETSCENVRYAPKCDSAKSQCVCHSDGTVCNEASEVCDWRDGSCTSDLCFGIECPSGETCIDGICKCGTEESCVGNDEMPYCLKGKCVTEDDCKEDQYDMCPYWKTMCDQMSWMKDGCPLTCSG